MQINQRDIRQNKTDRPKNILSIQQCPDCEFYDRQIQLLQPGQQYEVKAAASNECPNPECKSKNFAAVISEQEIEPFSQPVLGKKVGKYRHMVLEGRPHPDANGNGCTCVPFKEEWEFEPVNMEGRKDWEPTTHNQLCPNCNNQYYLEWTVTERNYI